MVRGVRGESLLTLGNTRNNWIFLKKFYLVSVAKCFSIRKICVIAAMTDTGLQRRGKIIRL